MAQIERLEVQREDLRRRLALSEQACAELREIVDGRPTDNMLSRDLAKIRSTAGGVEKTIIGLLETVGLLNARLEALAGGMGIGVLKEDAEDAEDPIDAIDRGDVWKITTETGLSVSLIHREGHARGCCSIVVHRPRGSARIWEVPVSPKMARGLLECLRRLLDPPKPGADSG